VLDAIERRGDRTRVLALEPVPAVRPLRLGRRDWNNWTDTGRLVVIDGPEYQDADTAWQALAGDGGGEAAPAVLIQPVVEREYPRLTGEARWVADRLLLSGANAAPSHPPAGTPTEEWLMSLARPIALVGNAAIHYPFGPRIDAYPTIIRFNNYRIRGFEDRVGTRTSSRCTSGWIDVEHRNELVEFSPFTADARESGHLQQFNRENQHAVLAARTDVRPLVTGTPNPSTGLALVQLLQVLGIPADLFGFDGFRSGHYWTPGPMWTTHSASEFECLLAAGDFVLYGDVVDDAGRIACQRLSSRESGGEAPRLVAS